MTYWKYSGGGAYFWRYPSCRFSSKSPDGIEGGDLRHHWQNPSDPFLIVVGSDPEEVEAEYFRLWEERNPSRKNPLKDFE